MQSKNLVTAAMLGCLCFVLGSGVAWAQATAQISGTVKDRTVAVLPGVDITLRHTATGTTRTAVTDGNGFFALPNLPLGSHGLQATLPGFRTYEQTGIVLQVNSNPVINVVLELGAVSETLEVRANAAMVETRGAGVGGVIEQEQVLQLPLNGRNVADLLVLTGQAVQIGSTTAGSRAVRGGDPTLAVGGGLRGGTTYTLDGAIVQESL